MRTTEGGELWCSNFLEAGLVKETRGVLGSKPGDSIREGKIERVISDPHKKRLSNYCSHRGNRGASSYNLGGKDGAKRVLQLLQK